ncbi:phosphatidate cytidylyltransferase [Candidatus Pelagibacter communis]|uniref:phosphatidate cytidylyltransferase n=1 Tax=Pelagibacter ubique TaxID=198252 RepID=UPI00094D163C|nr:phosphatidate cytidylyltransferase [Candidatus Pelagibacter ubique]
MIYNELLKRIISSLIIIPIALFFIIKGSFLFIFFILICFLITSYEWHKMSNKKPYYLPGFLFLMLSFYSAYIIRANDSNSLKFFLYILIVCVSTDIGGYIFGKIFKGPKLIKISPKKTYSGVIGGYLMSIILYYLFINLNYGDEINSKDFIFILLISTISQLGDITISYFKRLSKIKDTGKILPGHGGLLDRIDGMIFAFPAAYIIFKIININF